MGSVYTNAQTTVAYLGEADWNTDLVTLRGSKITQLSEHYKLEATQDVRLGDSIIQISGLAPKNSEAWLALMDYFHLAWFQRVWIVPEYGVSGCVMFVYGHQTYASPFPRDLLEVIMRFGLAWLLERGSKDSEESAISGMCWKMIRLLKQLRASE